VNDCLRNVALMLTWLAASSSTLARLWSWYLRDQRLEHIPLVLVVAAAVALREWSAGVLGPTRHDCSRSRSAGLLGAVGVALHLAARRCSFLAVEVLAVLCIFVAATIHIVGTRRARHLAPATLLLLLAVPVPDLIDTHVSFPLRTMATHGAAIAVDRLGTYAHASGTSIALEGGRRVTVDETCAGQRSLTVTLLVVFVLGTSLRMWSRRIALAVTAITASLTANTVRTALLCLLVAHDGAWVLDSPIHGLVGLMTFAVAMAVTIGAAVMLRED